MAIRPQFPKTLFRSISLGLVLLLSLRQGTAISKEDLSIQQWIRQRSVSLQPRNMSRRAIISRQGDVIARKNYPEYLLPTYGVFVIASPNYPKDYNNGSYSSWIISTQHQVDIIHMFCPSIDIEYASGCSYDYLYIVDDKHIDKRVCGKTLVYETTAEGTLGVAFRSDKYVSASGFVCYFWTVPYYVPGC